jgi:glycosyltransferase involved in cell wall biosynthesis
MARIVLASVISNLEFGGAEHQLVELANHLDVEKFEHHLISLSPHVPLAAELNGNAKLTIVEKRWKYDLGTVFKLARLFRTLGVEVAHGYLFDADIAVRLAGAIARVPVIVGSERNAEYRVKKRKLLAYRLTKPLLDLCIANSRAGAEFNQRITGSTPDRYVVVPNGVSVVRFHPAAQSEARRLLGLAPDEYIIGMVASFKAQKNHALLLRAAAALRSQGVPCRVVLVGDELYAGMRDSTSYKAGMLELIEQLGLAPYCTLLGNRSDLAALYPAFDITVLPSHFEGTPNVVLESMACGVPVVVTDVSDNRQLVPDGVAGYVIAPDDLDDLTDRLATLYREPARRTALGREARRWVIEQYSSERLARRTEDAYIAALERKRGYRRPLPASAKLGKTDSLSGR